MIRYISCGCANDNIVPLIECTDQSRSLIFNFSTSGLNWKYIGTILISPWALTSFAVMTSLEAKCYPTHDDAVGNESRIARFGSLDVNVLVQEIFVE